MPPAAPRSVRIMKNMSQQIYSVKDHNNRYSSLLIIGNNIPYALHLFQLPSENFLLK